MSPPSPLGANYRSPLGGFYRTPLRAFGRVVEVATVRPRFVGQETNTGFVTQFDCGINYVPDDAGSDVPFLFGTDYVDQAVPGAPTYAEFLTDIHDRTWYGAISNTALTLSSSPVVCTPGTSDGPVMDSSTNLGSSWDQFRFAEFSASRSNYNMFFRGHNPTLAFNAAGEVLWPSPVGSTVGLTYGDLGTGNEIDLPLCGGGTYPNARYNWTGGGIEVYSSLSGLNSTGFPLADFTAFVALDRPRNLLVQIDYERSDFGTRQLVSMNPDASDYPLGWPASACWNPQSFRNANYAIRWN